MIKLGISGITGKVGSCLIEALKHDKEISPVVGLARICGNIEGISIVDNIDKFLTQCDFVIDFSSPELIEKICDANKLHKKPIISGTSGLSDLQIIKLKENAEFTKVFWSMNTSYGVAMVSSIIENIAKAIPEAEIEIHEEHHNQKKDAPSGTAILLANKILKVKDGDNSCLKTDRNQKRNPSDIGFSVVRAGNTIGKHEISFYFDNQVIKISHEAFDRKIYALGAIKIAKIILSKPEKNGFFEISDIY